jgi:hypothetical protein
MGPEKMDWEDKREGNEGETGKKGGKKPSGPLWEATRSIWKPTVKSQGFSEGN